MMAVPAASRIATEGPAGRVQAAEPRFSTETSAPREPAAAPHAPPVKARSSGEHAPPPVAVAGADAAAVAAALGVGDGLVVVVAHAATRIASETRSVPWRARSGLFMCGPCSRPEVESASIIRLPGRRWGRHPFVAAGPLSRGGIGALTG